MGVLNAIQNGLARATGTLVGGYFYENYGPRVMWLATGFGVPLSLIGVAGFAYFKNSNDGVHEDVLEEAELFSPHAADPQALKGDGDLAYDEIE